MPKIYLIFVDSAQIIEHMVLLREMKHRNEQLPYIVSESHLHGVFNFPSISRSSMGEPNDWQQMMETVAAAAAAANDEVGDDTRDEARGRRSPRLQTTAGNTRPAAQQTTTNATAVAKGNKTIQINLFGRARPRAHAPPGDGNAPHNAAARAAEGAQHGAAGDRYVEQEPPMHIPLAPLERTRATKRKAPEGPRGRSKAGRSSKETSVSLKHRVEVDFKDAGLKVSGGKLFCGACKEELPNLKEAIKRHVSSLKHTKKLAAMERAATAGRQIYTDIAEHFTQHPHEHGVSLYSNQHRSIIAL